jgi:hypothetical protein
MPDILQLVAAIDSRLADIAAEITALDSAKAQLAAGHHVQHIFGKTGVRTRSAATVWAFERHLVQSA